MGYRKYIMHLAVVILLLVVTATPRQVFAETMQVEGIRAGDSLNVRTGPGTRYRDIGDLASGRRVQVYGYDSSGRWAIISWNSQRAYVSARYLARVGQGNNNHYTGLGMHRVRGISTNDADGGLVVRTGPGRFYGRILVVPNGVGLNIVEISVNGKWSRAIFSDGGTGWVRNSYLRPY